MVSYSMLLHHRYTIGICQQKKS